MDTDNRQTLQLHTHIWAELQMGNQKSDPRSTGSRYLGVAATTTNAFGWPTYLVRVVCLHTGTTPHIQCSDNMSRLVLPDGIRTKVLGLRRWL